MRKTSLCAVALAAVALGGCGQATTTFVKSDTTLGRVVVYRNGVAYFERTAEVTGDSLKLAVPDDKIDDFLKSLTVIDATTGQPAPISYPSGPQRGSTIDMKVGLGSKPGPHKLLVSYVTEAPSWKPSYRVVVGKDGKVEVNGWAIVDNTSGEDWKDVKLGVGASSAMSFRFDLQGLRHVQRETLQTNDLFAQAPPMGGASYGNAQAAARGRVVADVRDDQIAQYDFSGDRLTADATITKTEEARKVPAGGMMKKGSGNAGPPPPPVQAQAQAMNEVQRMARALQSSSNVAVVEGYAASGDRDKQAASLERANKLREQLVRNGVDPNRIVAVGRGEQSGRSGGARVVETEAKLDGKTLADNQPTTGRTANVDGGEASKDGAKENVKPSTEPIGTSHFESTTAMTVPKGTSAMVSILKSQTEGEVVYLYDPESPRGNTQFPFKTVRFRNPTDSALESGPVSVFGEGKFIGEGLAEPIPSRSVAFVPFALDRQIVVERKDAEHDAIAKIITVQRGVFSTEVKHTKKATFTLFNRLEEKVTVFIKHTVAPGYSLVKAPEGHIDHLAGALLFRVELAPNAKTDVSIEEATPVHRTADIRTTAGLDLVRAYLSNAAVQGPLKKDVEHLLALNADMAKVEQQIQTAREQMGEYRMRMDELHAQLVTLKAVKTAGPLMTHLEKKLQEISEKLSKSTVDVVALQEKLMVARVQFQTGVADLSLEKSDTREATNTK